MRLAVFVFSLLLIFNPINAYALLFIPAVKGAIIRTTAGQFVKVQSKRALMYGAPLVLYEWCKKTKKCDDIIENASELFGGDDSNTDNDDFVCDGVVMYNAYQGGGAKKSGSYLAHAKNNFYDYAVNISKNNAPDKEPLDPNFRLDGEPYEIGGTLNQIVRYNHYDFWGRETTSIIQVYKYCDTTQKTEIKKETEINITKEQIQKIVNNMSDDDVTYIINNYGDEIDVEKYCSENACDELSNEFGNEVNNNKDKYDIDKINKQNCVVQNGKIVSCENAKTEKDEDKDKDDKEQEKEEEGNEQKGDKIDCDASEFHKKVCDFIDWYQDDFEHDNTDTTADVDDKSDDLPKHKDYIKFNAQCPPDKIINLSFRVNKSLNWTYQDLCHAMIELKPFIIGFSMITGVFIISGRRV